MCVRTFKPVRNQREREFKGTGIVQRESTAGVKGSVSDPDSFGFVDPDSESGSGSGSGSRRTKVTNKKR